MSSQGTTSRQLRRGQFIIMIYITLQIQFHKISWLADVKTVRNRIDIGLRIYAFVLKIISYIVIKMFISY